MSVHSLLSYALEVPELETGCRFYTDFGLNAAARSERRVDLRCPGREGDQVTLLRGGPSKRLHHLRLGATSEGIAKLLGGMQALGLKAQSAAPGFSATGVWLRDPFGVLLHVVEAVREAPLPAEPPFRVNTPGHRERVARAAVPPKSQIGPIRPRRLGHVLLFTPDLDRSIEFYSTVLGMRLSDRAADVVAFMHCLGGSEHHVIAFAKSRATGFHHASFEVGSPDEVGIGGTRMIERGYGPGWGYGRHSIGSNFFWYIRDPWNSYAEYYCDMDYIPADSVWQATDWALEDSLHNWGPTPPDDFVKNYEAEI